MADGSVDLEGFRSHVRTWVAENFPAELKGAGAMMMREERTEPTPAMEAWRKAVGELGWGTPTWPKQYGGGGLSSAEARIVQGEFARAGAYNPIGGMGIMMFGPTLLEYGTEARSWSTSPRSARRRSSGVRASQSPAPDRTWPACRPRPRTRAITMSSTARRSGPAARNTPTGASAWCALTPQKSMRASASCSSPCTSRASRPGRSR